MVALLEDHCQKLAESGKELYIIAGPHGKGGHGQVVTRKKGEGKTKIAEKKNVFKSFIGKDDRVTVPAQCWKVINVIAVPLVLLGLVVAHIIALHEVGSNNPDGVEIKAKKDAQRPSRSTASRSIRTTRCTTSSA